MRGALVAALVVVGLLAVLWPGTPAAQDEQAWRDKMAAAMNAHRSRAYGAAEVRLKAALEMAEGFGPEDPRLAETLLALSTVYFDQDRYAEAQGPLERAVGMLERDRGRLLGPALIALAQVHTRQGNYEAADGIYVRALASMEETRGPDHQDVARVLVNLAGLRVGSGRYEEAEPFYRRALAIQEEALGPKHPDVARLVESYAGLLRLTGRAAEAEAMEDRVDEILGN
jgi:tetratricopeptide (TPR) repeat protein